MLLLLVVVVVPRSSVGAIHGPVDHVVHHAHRGEGQEHVEQQVHRVHVDLKKDINNDIVDPVQRRTKNV